MRHGKKFNHLKRKSAHRKALLRNLAISLIEHKRIVTTLAKAKALRQFIEPLVTKAKSNTMHSRRVVFSYLNNKEAVKELFGDIGPKVGDRPGGYVRVIKTGFRRGDGAETAMIEFVDYNEVYSAKTEEDSGGGRKRRRRRRGGGGNTAATATEEVSNDIEELEEEEEPETEEETEEGTAEENPESEEGEEQEK